MSDPSPLSESIRRKMQRQSSSNTQPELRLRRELFARGYRYRINFPVPGMPRRSIDIAFPKYRLAVMVDGCFWHGCPDHGPKPKHNADWWARKLAGNKARDEETTEALMHEGWLVLRVWEHMPVSEAVEHVVATLSSLRAPPRE